MRAHRLPGRIALVMIGSIVMSILTVGLSALWMAGELDRQAHAHNVTLARNAEAGLRAQLRVLMLDYAKWEAAVPHVQARDLGWLRANIGDTAVAGTSMQIAYLWGGALGEGLGWRAGGPAEGRAGVVDPYLLGRLERALARIPLNLYRGVEFFAWDRGQLYAVGAARLEADAPAAVADLVAFDARTPRLLIARRITPEAMARLGAEYLLDGLHIDRAEVAHPERHPDAIPLAGVDGRPVGWLAWTPTPLGHRMLARLARPLALVTLLTSALIATGMVLLRRNAGHLVLSEQDASRAARRDALTGLPNRLAFTEALEVPSPGGRAVLFLDVNGFKRVKDSYGHAAGDRLITDIAARLAPIAAPEGLLARISGDEFVVILPGPRAEPRVHALADRIHDALARGFDLRGHHLRVTVSMGYAVDQGEGGSAADLVRQADLAMYEAKRRRLEGPVAFSAVLDRASHDARSLERGLRRAIAGRGELALAWQPIVGLDGRMVRAEALARWSPPDSGAVPPDRFIAVAERAGLIVDLGQRLLDLVWEDLARHPALRAGVNVSPLQLLAPDFVPRLLEGAARHGIDPSRVELEITESVAVDDPELAAARIAALHEAGFTTALDDFGTGFSSIGALRRMGCGAIKVDRSFVRQAVASRADLSVLDGMILMAHGLGLTVTGEGIESEEELAILFALGCDFAQGYHLGRPMPVAELAARWLRPARRRAGAA